MENPGLKDYDLTNYRGVSNTNFFEEDSALKRIIQRHTESLQREHAEEMREHLSGYGKLVGGILNDLTLKCHVEGKYGELQKYDKTGKRIDEIVYSPEQIESRRLSYEYGVVNLDFHKSWKHEFTNVHRYALTYLMNLNGEGGVACPLAMTDGMILALKKIGTEEQKKKYLPLVAGEDSKSYFMAGQYVTERVGGSNVGANRTIARKREDGKWILTGEKWFCSNPGDLWVTTARIGESSLIGLFLVHRFKENGELNGHHILRKKDIIGSRGKVTAEVVYDELEAEELGRPAHGLVNLIKYVIKISRIHVGFGACGNSRRAVMEAFEYARFRTAYGKGLNEFPIYSKNLAVMHVLQTTLTFANFKSIEFWEKDLPISEVIVPLLKYRSSSQATSLCRTAILSLSGNGIIGDFSPLPRLLNDSIINESWEGTHFLLTEHILRALEKPKSGKAFLEYLEESYSGLSGIDIDKIFVSQFRNLIDQLKTLLSHDKKYRELYRIQIAELAYACYGVSVLSEEIQYDLKTQSESIYTILGRSFSDLMTFGVEGILPETSPLVSGESIGKILNY